jgi:adenylate kinase
MRSVFLGPPGAGKGTQARQLAAEGLAQHISTGDLLRQEVSRGTPLGLEAKQSMEQGKLVPDVLVFEILFARLGQGKKPVRDFILDGFPRTRAQALELDRRLKEQGLPLTVVVNFQLSEEAAVRRLSSRLLCGQCQAAYNEASARPEKDLICDVCGGVLKRRPDDEPQVVRVRFQEYRSKSEELVRHYEQAGLLANVNAELPANEVAVQVRKLLLDRRAG